MVPYAFDWGKLLTCHLKENWQMDIIIDYSGNKWPKGFIGPCTGAKYHNIQMFIGICSRSQVSVYRTIGPLVFS